MNSYFMILGLWTCRGNGERSIFTSAFCIMKKLAEMKATVSNFHLHLCWWIVFLQVPVTNDSDTESQTPVPETKKRKSEEESESQEEKPPKKTITSSSSKLMAFAFKKSWNSETGFMGCILWMCQTACRLSRFYNSFCMFVSS